MNEERKRKSSQQDDSEDESEILEESPCGRWQKRGEELERRNIPGIDSAFLAMDTEEGVEVVWNEVNILEKWDHKQAKAKEEKIKVALDQLIQLDHPNIVKMHKYWIDVKEDANPRVIFITEYMSSGSLKQFLKKTKRNVIKMALPAWKRWCTQLLSALCYMHSSSPPIIHGNLSCDTICISHTGLIKIDAVAPNAIQRSLRSSRQEFPRNLHYMAPEIVYKDEVNCFPAPFSPVITAAMDIYSFGICALEMAALEITATPDSNHITQELVMKTIESLDNSLQKDFIRACLNQYPIKRPTARSLLFHQVIFEVPSLRLLSAHVVVNTPSFQPEQLTDEALQKRHEAHEVLAEVKSSSGAVISSFKYSEVARKEIEKFLEEVRNGAYPLTALVPTYRPPVISRHRNSPELPDSPETFDVETRRIISVGCDIKNNSVCSGQLSLNFRMEDKMNRHVCCDLRPDGDPSVLVEELLRFGLIPAEDRDAVKNAIDAQVKKSAPQKS